MFALLQYTSILVLLVGCAVVQVHTSQPEIRKVTIGELVRDKPELLQVLLSVKSKSGSLTTSPPTSSTTASTTTPATTTVSNQSTTKESTTRGETSPGGRRRKIPRRRRPQGGRRNRQRGNQEQQETSPSKPQNARHFPTAP